MAAKEPLCSAVSMIRALRTPRVRIDTIDRNGSGEAVMVYHANDVRILAGPLALPWKLWSLWRNWGGRHVGAISEPNRSSILHSPWVSVQKSQPRKVAH